LDHQNNYLELSRTLKLVTRMSKFFAVLSSCLSILHNYFDDPTKLFSDLHVGKFLDTSVKNFFLPFFLIFEIRCRIVFALKTELIRYEFAPFLF